MNNFIVDVLAVLTGIGNIPYLYLGMYLLLAAIYGVLWYFKRPVIKSLRKWDALAHIFLALIVWFFGLIFTIVVYVPPVYEPLKYTPVIVELFPWMMTVALFMQVMYFVVQWLIIIRKNIPGDI